MTINMTSSSATNVPRRVLGIDPGSRYTGYGIIDATAQTHNMVACGVIVLKPSLPMHQRLQQIYTELTALIQQYNPVVMGLETVFIAKNPSAALKLGQARGAAMVAASMQSLVVHEYAPRAIKLAVTGVGSADKLQVEKMVRLLLSISASEVLRADAADALAIAICCAQQLNLR